MLVDVVILLAVLLREADVLDDCNFDIRLRLIESVLWPFILSQFEVLLKGMVLLTKFEGRDHTSFRARFRGVDPLLDTLIAGVGVGRRTH